MKLKTTSPSAKLKNLLNRRFAVSDKRGGFRMRIRWSKPKGKRAGHWIVRCGCCSEGPVKIYPDFGDGFTEINDVMGRTKEWIQMIRFGFCDSKTKKK